MKLACLLILMCVFPSLSAKPLALLIGNSDYENCPKLDNPVNDVGLVSKRLTEGGYNVTLLKDANLVEMTKGLARFSEKAKGAEKVVFFYAGHGIEVDGSNYIIPVDARLEKKGDQKWEALSLTNVLTELKVAKVKVVVLDCCRDDPFGATRSWRRTRAVSKGGMAAVRTNQLSRGSMVVYSGKPGQTVPDGVKGGNSPFTKAWNKELLRAQGKSIMAVFSDMGDFLPSENKHWVKIDSDGESLALLNRTQLLKELAKGEKLEVAPQGKVAPVPPEFVHHRLDRDTLVYSGIYEEDEAYFALSWNSPREFTGYCFLHEGGTLYYLNGELVAPAKMEISLWYQGRKVRFARLNQVKNLGAESWEGKTNLGTVSFSKEKSNKKNASIKADYAGSLGVEDAKLSLRWTTVEKVAGRLELDKGRVWRLVGDNSLKGTMFINVYGANGHQAVAVLKRSSFNGVSWSGQLHFNDGHKELLSVRR